MELIGKIIADAPLYISAVVAVISAIIGVCLLIPGNEPESTLQKVVDVLAKLSKK